MDYGRRLSIFSSNFLPPKPEPEVVVAYDFGANNNISNKDDDNKDDTNDLSLWEYFTKVCYSQTPPIPALSLMRPILNGEEQDAIFPHQHISTHISVVLKLLSKIKVINNLNLSDNSLRPSCAQPIIDFVKEDEQLSSLDISDNPLIGPQAMIQLLEGIKESVSLETLIMSNTGCTRHVGSSIAQFVDNCKTLIRLDASQCELKQSALDLVPVLPNAPKLKQLILAKNMLFVGGRRFATQFGGSIGKCETLKKLDLSMNALTHDQITVLMKGISSAPKLSSLNLSKNCIGEPGGRPIALFLGKTSSIKYLDISQNQLLNVTVNKIRGQMKMEEESKKPGGKDKKGPKNYTPGCYWIINSLMKNGSLPMKPIKIRMIGLVVDAAEWEEKIEALRNTNPNIEIEYKAPCNQSFAFRRPQTAAPIAPPMSARKDAAPRAPATARREKK